MKNINNKTRTEEAVVFIQEEEILFLMKGDFVYIKTDGEYPSEYNREYKEVQIETITPDAIWLYDEKEYLDIECVEELKLLRRC